MAAPRKWSDAQRAAMYALWEQGIGAAEIGRRCHAGLASVTAFEIPRRTVHAICTAMEKERGAEVPRTLNEAAQAATEGRYLERVQNLVNDEIVRLEAKPGPLTAVELSRAEQAASIGVSLERHIARRKPKTRQNWRPEQRSADAPELALSPLEELAQRIIEEEQASERVTEPGKAHGDGGESDGP